MGKYQTKKHFAHYVQKQAFACISTSWTERAINFVQVDMW